MPDSVFGSYFDKVSSPEDADFAIVFVKSPFSLYMGYDTDDLEKGGTGYIPISLQYEDYTAESAREHSIAGGDPFEAFQNRSYNGKTASTANKDDLRLLRETRSQMGDKPIVLIISMSNPMVMSEVEPLADAILISFDVQAQALLDVISGGYEPSGLLPMQLPRDMKTVEEHCEDTPMDMECYKDSQDNVYDFAFGLDWSGVIADHRVAHYSKHHD
jgi:beta-glucosidase